MKVIELDWATDEELETSPTEEEAKKLPGGLLCEHCRFVWVTGAAGVKKELAHFLAKHQEHAPEGFPVGVLKGRVFYSSERAFPPNKVRN